MKIGIITIPPYSNYGGILQAYALGHVLQGMGHETEVVYVRKRWHLPLWKMPLSYTKRAIKKYILRRQAWIFYEKKAERDWAITTKNIFGFVEKYIPHRVYERYSAIQEGDYDAYVVGSDQVWRPPYFVSGDIEDAYLRFAENWNVKRVAYATSFGVDHWEYTPKQTAECARLAKKFEGVTVREASAVDLCRKYLGIEAKHVIDPTLLLARSDYEALIHDDSAPHKGEILSYVLDWNDEKRSFLEKLEASTGKHSFRANSRFEEWMAPVEERIQPSVESWLQGFRDADMVVTDSFHACVFSIIFNKPFYVIGNKERGLTRIHSLLSMFGLEGRLVSELPTSETSIDWDKVNNQIKELQTVSFDFLNKSLR